MKAMENTILFLDDFDGGDIDRTRWERCPEEARQGGAAIWNDAMSYLDGRGHLVLRAEWDNENKCVRSGAVRTKGLFEGGFGFYEASIKFPVAKGIWGAFWLMCGNVASVSGTAADGVEIDVIESINNERGTYNLALHYDGYGDSLKSVKTGLICDQKIYDGSFHLFALDRSEGGYVFYIDGKEQWRVSPDTCAPCAEKGYMKLTIEAADWAGAGTPDAISALPCEMLVDYVKVYSKNPYTT